ncbi:MAG: phosphatidylglycerophosphatase A [Gammaproteobacteria bacterium]|nr:phosphatidylglycerophosphatase A [Gammaproteobacteria bacterium]
MPDASRPRLKDPVHLLAFGFGAGLVPRAPGTAGSLLGLALYVPLSTLPLTIYLPLLAGLFVAGIWVCGKTAVDLGVHDHGGIVYDEIVGVLVAMTALPRDWIWLLAGFVLFRVLDILKPWPIRLLDRRVTGGFGIMLDDLVAGAMTAAVLQSALLLL